MGKPIENFLQHSESDKVVHYCHTFLSLQQAMDNADLSSVMLGSGRLPIHSILIDDLSVCLVSDHVGWVGPIPV